MASNAESLRPEVPMELDIICQARVSATCLVVGPEACGKTALVSALIKQYKDVLGKLNFKSASIFSETRAMRYVYEGSFNQLTLVDMPGITMPKTDRLKCYENVNLICYCYAIDACFSLKHLVTWVKELNIYLPGVPSILVACKSDLREQDITSRQTPKLIPNEIGLNFRKKFKIIKFYEFSENNSSDAINEVLTGIFDIVSGKSMPEASHSQRNALYECCTPC